jgi:hypothetical protein
LTAAKAVLLVFRQWKIQCMMIKLTGHHNAQGHQPGCLTRMFEMKTETTAENNRGALQFSVVTFHGNLT